MEIVVIGSSSKGNCYLLRGMTETLILEAGVKLVNVKKALGYDFNNVVGCLITHEHKDHSAAAAEMISNGVPLYASAGTLAAIGLDPIFTPCVLVAKMPLTIGGFKILPFATTHDAAEPLGFLINHAEAGDMLFVTDTAALDYTFENLRHIFIECNFDKASLLNSAAKGLMPFAVYQRIIDNHFSFEKLSQWLRLNRLAMVENILLLHTSAKNANGEQYCKDIIKQTGKPTALATKDTIINLTL